MPNSAIVKLVVLIVGLSLLVVGGSYLYKQSQKSEQTGQDKQSEQTQVAQTEEAVKNTKIPSLPASPSAQQTNKYVTQVQTQAVESQTLSFSGCIANPDIFKVKQGESFSIKNNDDKEIKISISPKAIYSVGANKSAQVTMQAEAAIYKYSCAQTGGVATSQSGIIYVTK